MSRLPRSPSIALPLSLSLAPVLFFLPRTWIEATFAVDPDGGSGVLELMFVSLPVAIAFAAYLFRRPSRAPRVTDSDTRSFPAELL